MLPGCSLAWRRLAGALTLTLSLYGCGGNAGTRTTPPPPDPPANATDPRWMVQHNPPAQVALVFVHGVFGDTVGTWTRAGGPSFFDLLTANAQVGPKVDMLAFGYTSNMFTAGSLDIQEAANTLHARLQFHGVLDYPAIVFVTHSMGGLVVLRELLTHRELLPQVPGVVMFATPQEGAQISVIAKAVASNPALEQMLPADRNGYLRVMSDEWNALAAEVRPQVRCAYEKRPTHGVMVVPWASATRFCQGTPVAIDADHLSIVKPDRPEHDAMVVLVNALNELVVGKTFVATLETPDFVKDGDRAIFTLSNPLGSAARLVNAGGSPLRYTVAQVSDPHLFVWPADTPKEMPARTTDRLQFALGFGASAAEYSFTLTSNAAPPLPVVVRVADPSAVVTRQVALANQVSQGLVALLAEPQRLASFGAAAADDAAVPRAVVQAAREVIARQNPDLPEDATWVLTADLMDAANWPGLAILALRRAEETAPATAQSPAVQRLAGVVAAHAGQPRVFVSAATPVAPPETGERAQPLVDARAAASAAALAPLMQRIPALTAQGLSLRGDLQRARGDVDGARVTYTEAAAIRLSPSISSRLEKVTRTGAATGSTAGAIVATGNRPSPVPGITPKATKKVPR